MELFEQISRDRVREGLWIGARWRSVMVFTV
jgi:hypothetical protein